VRRDSPIVRDRRAGGHYDVEPVTGQNAEP